MRRFVFERGDDALVVAPAADWHHSVVEAEERAINLKAAGDKKIVKINNYTSKCHYKYIVCFSSRVTKPKRQNSFIYD